MKIVSTVLAPFIVVGSYSSFESDFFGIEFDVETKSPLAKQMFTDTAQTGAVCLDGTPAGFYFSPAADTASSNIWQLYFEGGGW